MITLADPTAPCNSASAIGSISISKCCSYASGVCNLWSWEVAVESWVRALPIEAVLFKDGIGEGGVRFELALDLIDGNVGKELRHVWRHYDIQNFHSLAVGEGRSGSIKAMAEPHIDPGASHCQGTVARWNEEPAELRDIGVIP